jgi:hypothetical protein
MDWIWRSVVRVTVAALVGVAFHAAWVALFILAVSQGAPGSLRAILWVIAPIVTAIGFGLGLTLLQRRHPAPDTGFAHAFAIALAGCAMGAVILSPIGPMFAGFGVLGGGTIAAAIRVVSEQSGRGRRAGERPVR